MITVTKNPFADTRSCDYLSVTKEQLAAASAAHIEDIREALGFFIARLKIAAVIHDEDKLSDIDGFHANFLTGFSEQDWLQRHYVKNRHHLHAGGRVPDDVNLIDVLDFVADQVMSSAARGTFRPATLPNEVLQRAVENTVELLKAQIVVAP